jgi:hypothetical protein
LLQKNAVNGTVTREILYLTLLTTRAGSLKHEQFAESCAKQGESLSIAFAIPKEIRIAGLKYNELTARFRSLQDC